MSRALLHNLRGDWTGQSANRSTAPVPAPAMILLLKIGLCCSSLCLCLSSSSDAPTFFLLRPHVSAQEALPAGYCERYLASTMSYVQRETPVRFAFCTFSLGWLITMSHADNSGALRASRPRPVWRTRCGMAPPPLSTTIAAGMISPCAYHSIAHCPTTPLGAWLDLSDRSPARLLRPCTFWPTDPRHPQQSVLP